MPNWCSNSITISGSTDTIKQLWDDAHVGDDFGLLNAMVPMPKELEGTTAPSEEANWYEWCIENWGTKWDITDEGLEYIDNGDGTSVIAGWFDSAWGPPIEAYNTFLDDMDGCSLSATYEEGGMDFAGIYEDGEDQYLEGISDLAREKVKTGNSGDPLYDLLDAELDLTESRLDYIQEEMSEAELEESD